MLRFFLGATGLVGIAVSTRVSLPFVFHLRRQLRTLHRTTRPDHRGSSPSRRLRRDNDSTRRTLESKTQRRLSERACFPSDQSTMTFWQGSS